MAVASHTPRQRHLAWAEGCVPLTKRAYDAAASAVGAVVRPPLPSDDVPPSPPKARAPLIKLAATNATPDMPLRPEHKWHLFLSHVYVTKRPTQLHSATQPRRASNAPPRTPTPTISDCEEPLVHACCHRSWGSAQDQTATIKRQLFLLLAGAVSIFLDVDESATLRYEPRKRRAI